MSQLPFAQQRLRRILLLALIAAITVCATASAAGPKPDLISDPAEWPVVVEDVDGDGNARLLLRFNGYVHNVGFGPLEIQGAGRVDPDGAGPLYPRMTSVEQVIKPDPEVPGDTEQRIDVPLGRIQYEDLDGHHHYHFMDAALYRLFDKTGTSLVAPSQKVGFCMMDSQWRNPRDYYGGTDPLPDTHRYYSDEPGSPVEHCRQNNPTANDVLMGISYGYRDTYMYWLALQWVDVSDVQPGEYTLRSEVDPDDRLVERNENNGQGDTPIRIKGYVAKPQAVLRKAGQAKAIQLTADAHQPMAVTPVPEDQGGPLPEQTPLQGATYEIVTQPQHGTLEGSGNSWIYVPNDKNGVTPDSFTFRVREAGNPFPRNPQVATVSIGENPVAISAPGSVTAGKTATLQATGGDVDWYVNGVKGGNADVGTVTATSGTTATLTAPKTAGKITVRAQLKTDARAIDEAQIDVVAEPPVVPAPLPPGPENPAPNAPGDMTPLPDFATLPKGKTISTAKASWIGPQAVVSVKAGRNGRLTIVVRGSRKVRGKTVKRTLGRCSRKVVAGRTYACRVRAKARKGEKVDASITLKPTKGAVARKTLRFKSPHAKAAHHHDHGAHGH